MQLHRCVLAEVVIWVGAPVGGRQRISRVMMAKEGNCNGLGPV